MLHDETDRGRVTGGSGVTDGGERRRNLVAALQTVLAWFLGVFYMVFAVNHAFLEGGALDDLLRLLGSVHVDAVSLYLMLEGFLACEFVTRGRGDEVTTTLREAEAGQRELVVENVGLAGATVSRSVYVRGVMRALLPDVVLSAVMHLVLQAILCPTCWWDWANSGLAPVALSGFADVRVENVMRAPSELSWVVQAQMVLLVAAYDIFDRMRQLASTPRQVTWFVGVAWLSSAGHMYVAAMYPRYVNIIVRNVFTSMIFFASGVLVGLAPHTSGMFDVVRRTGDAVGVRGVVVAGVVLTLFYMHHLDGGGRERECLSVYGGTPCLWVVDSFNGRLLPLQMLFLAWMASGDTFFPPWLAGALEEPLTTPLRHVIDLLSLGHRFGTPWILYGDVAALVVHAPLAYILPAGATFVVFPVEVVLVTWGVARARDAAGAMIERLYERAETACCAPLAPETA